MSERCGRVEINPSGIGDSYLRGLASCFPGAWDAARYAWYHSRPFLGRRADILAVFDGREIVAGAAVNFRQLQTSTGRPIDIGVMTAAWTLPAHRGRWHLSRLVRAARRLGEDNGYEALIAFVRADNASSTILRHAGAAPVPSYYLQRAVRPNGPGRPYGSRPRRSAGGLERPACGALDDGQATVSFHYATSRDWRTQYIDRPWRSDRLESDGCSLIVDYQDSTERLQFVDGPAESRGQAILSIAEQAARRGRAFFHFSTSADVAARATAHGLHVARGHIMVFDLTRAASAGAERPHPSGSLDRCRWLVHSIDRL